MTNKKTTTDPIENKQKKKHSKKKKKAPEQIAFPFQDVKSKINAIKKEFSHLVPEDGYISIKKLWLFYYRINIYQILKDSSYFGKATKMVDSRFIEVIDTNSGWKIEEKHPS